MMRRVTRVLGPALVVAVMAACSGGASVADSTTTTDWRPPERGAAPTSTTMPGLTPAFCAAGGRYLALSALQGEELGTAFSEASAVLEELAAEAPDQLAATARELLAISEGVAADMAAAPTPEVQASIIEAAEAAAVEAGLPALVGGITQCPDVGPPLTPAFCDAGARYLALASLQGGDVKAAYAEAAAVLEDLAATAPEQYARIARDLLSISEGVAAELENAQTPEAQAQVIVVAESEANDAGLLALVEAIVQCPEPG